MKPLEQLHLKQAKLKAEIQVQEKQLSAKIKYLEENAGKMAINSFLPFSSTQFERASGLFSSLNSVILKLVPGAVGEEKKQKLQSVLKTVEMTAAGLAFKYISKFLK